MANAWDRLAAESDEEFTAFVRFRDNKPPRKVLRDSTVPTAKLAAWYRQHDWQARAVAWDMHLDGIRQAEFEEATRDDAKQVAAEHRLILKDARELVQLEIAKYLRTSQESEAHGLLKPGELTKLLEAMIKFDRLVRDQSTSKEETILDLKNLDVDELRQLADLESKARGAQ